jgi:hypothetical protein
MSGRVAHASCAPSACSTQQRWQTNRIVSPVGMRGQRLRASSSAFVNPTQAIQMGQAASSTASSRSETQQRHPAHILRAALFLKHQLKHCAGLVPLTILSWLVFFLPIPVFHPFSAADRLILKIVAGNAGTNGPFAPLVRVVRNAMGVKPFNQFRGKAISLHSQGKQGVTG